VYDVTLFGGVRCHTFLAGRSEGRAVSHFNCPAWLLGGGMWQHNCCRGFVL
jgi:hypothetical protein